MKTDNRILIEVSQIARAPMHAEGEVDGVEVFALPNDPVARPDGPIRYSLDAELVGGGEIVVTGAVSAPFRLLCGRCAGFFSTFAKNESFLRTYAWDDHPEVLDVTDDVREDLLLEIPGYPLCDPACKGLCPRCGKNLNDGACGCPPLPDGGEGQWSALDGWKEEPPAGPRNQ